MNSFQKRTAIRIAAISVILAAIASSVSWFVARENAEEGIVSLAIEESSGLLRHFSAINLDAPNSAERAMDAARTILGGLFDIAEIYDSNGRKLAEAMTPEGEAVESSLPKHAAPGYVEASYESMDSPEGIGFCGFSCRCAIRERAPPGPFQDILKECVLCLLGSGTRYLSVP